MRFLEQQQHYFLRKWTDQGENFSEVDEGEFRESPNPRQPETIPMPNDQFPTATPPILQKERHSDFISKPQNRVVNSGEKSNFDKITSPEALSQTEPSSRLFITSDGILPTQIAPVSLEIFRDYSAWMEGPCCKFLPFCLRKYKIMVPWDSYALTLSMVMWSDV
jgi:hypothetical protein